MHNADMTLLLAASFKKSQQLSTLAKIVFTSSKFAVPPTVEFIVKKKRFNQDKTLHIANLKNCLVSIRLTSVIKEKLQEYRKELFTYQQLDHVRLLERLWKGLKPYIQRSQERLSEEWGEIGFQGKDPATDFRGMGLFGLMQLVYYAETHGNDARMILELSQLAHLYFPFSATGINMTAFVIELFDEEYLHEYIYRRMDDILLQETTNSPNGCSDDPVCLLYSIELIHEVYCQLFTEFGKLWANSKPKNILEFPVIFGSFKKEVKSRYRKILN
jgi:hypothetical protein